jgi:DnaJ-domain-containing protein 1
MIAEAKAAEEARMIAEAKAAEEARMNTIAFIVTLVIGVILLIALTKRKKKNKKSRDDTTNNWKKDNQERIFCTNCGNEIINSTQFCTNCGQSKEKTYERNFHNESEITLKDCYKLLELDSTATAFEIKAARNRLAIQWHPDKHRSLDRKAIAEKEIKKINAAYEKLRKAGKLG